MSVRRGILQSAAMVAVLAMAGPVAGQGSPLSVEGRTGITFATGDLSDAGAGSGPLFAVDLILNVDRALSLYGGWAYHQFGCDACGETLSASGPRLGVKALFHTPGDALPWVRAGATYNEFDGLGAGSDRALGLEAGAGIDYALSDRVSITPAARYETFSPEFGGGTATVSYLTLDLGIHLHF
ncbi:MAG: outer membrane beta-barrel protein [Longimicrobiales bacterium]|nr:outer membrane beta-barrel protein [Longimicrobiales bacterium]